MGETNPLKRLIEWRVSAALEPTPPNETLLKVQQPVYDLLNKYWFRLEVTGWDRVPDRPCLVSGVPILPVATVGGHDTVFVVSEGTWLANALDKVTGLKKTLRGANLPIVDGFPFPLAVEVLPAHLPLPAKIRTELLEPIAVDDGPEGADDETYVRSVYDQVQAAIQTGMDALAAKRTLPVFG